MLALLGRGLFPFEPILLLHPLVHLNHLIGRQAREQEFSRGAGFGRRLRAEAARTRGRRPV